MGLFLLLLLSGPGPEVIPCFGLKLTLGYLTRPHSHVKVVKKRR